MVGWWLLRSFDAAPCSRGLGKLISRASRLASHRRSIGRHGRPKGAAGGAVSREAGTVVADGRL